MTCYLVHTVKYEPRLHIVLYQPEIPPNTGAVGRTCVALGAKLWLIRPLGFRVDQRTLKRAGLDYWQHLEWEVADHWEAFQRQMPDCNPWMFTKSANNDYCDAAFAVGDVMVFGSETAGLPASMLNLNPSRNLRIPIRPEVRSLNLSNSVAIAGYEATRQWLASGLIEPF